MSIAEAPPETQDRVDPSEDEDFSMVVPRPLDTKYTDQLAELEERTKIQQDLANRIPQLTLPELRSLVRQMDETLIHDGERDS